MAKRHAERARDPNLRRLIAVEAARIMAEQGVRDFHLAKLKAQERLHAADERDLPGNAEIDQALREHQALFQSDRQPALLAQRRRAALEAMEFFARFEPRLVGAVLDGSADEHSAVCLHLHVDDLREVLEFVASHRIDAEEETRRLRLDRERSAEVPVFLFEAGGTPIDLTVLPYDALRQAPLSRIDGEPIKRAGRAAVERLLAAG